MKYECFGLANALPGGRKKQKREEGSGIDTVPFSGPKSVPEKMITRAAGSFDRNASKYVGDLQQ